MHIRTRHALVALAVGVSTIALSAPGSAFASAPISPAVSGGARPEGAGLYADAAFDAWIAVDGATLVDLAAPEVVQLLAARSADEEGTWAGIASVCDGAAGSVYCSRSSFNVTLTLRVANQAASTGAAHAVTEAAFTPPPGGVAMWPVVTTDDAWRTQATVDAGQSQYILDPERVVSEYGIGEFGFTQPVVESVAPTFFRYRVIDGATGIAAAVEVNQPARQERGGIWAVARVVSLPADSPVIPL
ncbi:MAG: hypothetical protein QOG43_183 [Actinomycetota bacterium]|jgi:hypothetical protein|nr:hypothetical protein [Actinomycetota bacterium]